ncbi:MAG: toll/interleukin-1 receptor domain-containing protein [Granulosicoccus sp.]
MNKNRIFLSYRRDDSPGYVSRLEQELEGAFGKGRVFRDTTDIPGGTKWKNVIDANLNNSAVLLLIVGPRWESIWHDRINDEVNYIALEIMRAQELGIPIFPVTLGGTQLSKGLDLGSINFIYENQFHDISDRQGRWSGDFDQLVRQLETVPGMGSAQSQGAALPKIPKKSGKSTLKWVAACAALVIITVVWFGRDADIDVPVAKDDPSDPLKEVLIANKAQHERIPAEQTAANVSQAAAEKPTSASANTTNQTFPDISGKWLGQAGNVVYVQQYNDGTFIIDSPGYGTGKGRFFTKLPRKFEVEIFGIGRGEYSVSATNDKAMGWMIINGQQQYETLVRIQ